MIKILLIEGRSQHGARGHPPPGRSSCPPVRKISFAALCTVHKTVMSRRMSDPGHMLSLHNWLRNYSTAQSMAIVKGQTPILYTGMELVDNCTKLYEYIDNCIQIHQLNSMPNFLTSFIFPSIYIREGNTRTHPLNDWINNELMISLMACQNNAWFSLLH